MIAEHHNPTQVETNIYKQIKIKETQLKIALESNMAHVVEALERQLLELRNSEPKAETDFQALMSLLDE